jgi:hypothetical protein
VNLRNFFAEVSGGKVYKIAVVYAGTSWLFYYSFWVFLVQDYEGRAKQPTQC